MADTKITGLTANTTPATTDLLPMVDDPGGTPVTQKITIADLLKVINGLTADSSPDGAADYVVTYDASAGAAKKVLLNLLGTGSDAELSALAGLTSAANSFPYFTGSGTASLLVIVSAIRTLLASADVATFRTNAGLGTGDSPQFTGIELGHASDTTITRNAAGVVQVEGVVIPSISSTNTLTNKRVTPRVGTTTSSATPTINTDNVDIYTLTAQTADITSFTTNLSGTPTDGQKLWIAITGTAARAITWGSSFEASTIALPTTTVSTNRLDVGFIWNAATSKWRCVGYA